MLTRRMVLNLIIVLAALMLSACGAAGTQEAAAPAVTVEPSATLVPATPTEQAPPTATPEPPTATPEAATETPAATEPPTGEAMAEASATPIPATATAEPPTATPEPQPRTFAVAPGGSLASYSVEEEFFGIGFNTAVGTTSEVSGEFSVVVDADRTPRAVEGEISVDLRTLTSDESDRDQNIRENWLESDKYPFAVFEFTRLEAFPDNWAEGEEISFKLVGNLTVREVTQPLTFDVTAIFDGQTLRGTATTSLLMVDFGFEPPSIAGVLKVSDGVTVTLEFVAEETGG